MACDLAGRTVGLAGRRNAASSVTGTVTYDGKVPTLKPLAMDADPVCAKKHPTPVPSEMLVLGSGNTMANIIVSREGRARRARPIRRRRPRW